MITKYECIYKCDTTIFFPAGRYFLIHMVTVALKTLAEFVGCLLSPLCYGIVLNRIAIEK